MSNYDDNDDVDGRKPSLLTWFDRTRWDAESLAMKSIHNIQLPLCGTRFQLSQLSPANCLELMKYELDNWSNQNQLSEETIFLNYLITDYISCGISSPGFYTEFHKTLHSNKSLIKLLKDLITIWDCLLKSYKITSINVEFVKRLVVILNRIFVKMSNYVPSFNMKWRWNKVIDKIKCNVKVYEDEQVILNRQVFNASSDNCMQPDILFKEFQKFPIPKKSIVLKVCTSAQKSCIDKKNKLIQQNMECLKNMALDALNANTKRSSLQLYTSEQLADDNQPKKPKLMTVDEENAKPDPESTKKPETIQKLNVFQLMMLNAKKRKAMAK